MADDPTYRLALSEATSQGLWFLASPASRSGLQSRPRSEDSQHSYFTKDARTVFVECKNTAYAVDVASLDNGSVI